MPQKKPPRVIITDKLRSYAAAKKPILPEVVHRQSHYLNNRAENSHQPTRMRERQMKRFQSPEQAQYFLSTFESINAPFRIRRHLLSATHYRFLLGKAFQLWNQSIQPSSRLQDHYGQPRLISASASHFPIKVDDALTWSSSIVARLSARCRIVMWPAT